MVQFSIFDNFTGDKICEGNAYDCAEVLKCDAREIYHIGVGRNRKYNAIRDDSASHKWRKGKRLVYTVYDKHDNVLCSGTSDECADFLGYKNSQRFLEIVSKTKKGITSKYTFVTGYCDE